VVTSTAPCTILLLSVLKVDAGLTLVIFEGVPLRDPVPTETEVKAFTKEADWAVDVPVTNFFSIFKPLFPGIVAVRLRHHCLNLFDSHHDAFHSLFLLSFLVLCPSQWGLGGNFTLPMACLLSQVAVLARLTFVGSHSYRCPLPSPRPRSRGTLGRTLELPWESSPFSRPGSLIEPGLAAVGVVGHAAGCGAPLQIVLIGNLEVIIRHVEFELIVIVEEGFEVGRGGLIVLLLEHLNKLVILLDIVIKPIHGGKVACEASGDHVGVIGAVERGELLDAVHNFFLLSVVGTSVARSPVGGQLAGDTLSFQYEGGTLKVIGLTPEGQPLATVADFHEPERMYTGHHQLMTHRFFNGQLVIYLFHNVLSFVFVVEEAMPLRGRRFG